jgi:predicted RNA-binding Zn-ribbon protein involved in translation (DUF1610 family)
MRLTNLPNEILCRIFVFLDFESHRELEKAIPMFEEIYENNLSIIKIIRKELIIEYKVYFDKEKIINNEIYIKHSKDYIILIIEPYTENIKYKIDNLKKLKCPDCGTDLIWTEDCNDKYTGFLCKKCFWDYGLCKKWNSWL